MTKASFSIGDLLAIMARLRDPQQGCPWDREQTFETICPYTIEEVYEVADTIDRKDYPALCDELGDLLLQIVFQARIAEEAGLFAFGDVVTAICNKMTQRHPHVFGGESVTSAQEQSLRWEEIKRRERKTSSDDSHLAGISPGLPEWQRAQKLLGRAARAGFVWPDAGPVIDKLHEELEELRAELTAGDNPAGLSDEIGDILFVCTNLARYAGTDVSAALRSANRKFERRFRRMEALALHQGSSLNELSLAEQENLWQQVKCEEQSGKTG